jgi:hypothetical protein
MAPSVTPLSPIGKMAAMAGNQRGVAGFATVAAAQGCCSGLPAAAKPPPVNSADRSIMVRSAWKVFFLNEDIAAGLLATTERHRRRWRCPRRHGPSP